MSIASVHPLLSALPAAAYCAGLAHDLGKASNATQTMLREGALEPARHEWVSAWYLSHVLRLPSEQSDLLGWPKGPTWGHVQLPPEPFRFASVADAVSFATLTHHRLPASMRSATVIDTSAYVRAARGANACAPPPWAPSLAHAAACSAFADVVTSVRARLPTQHSTGSQPGYFALAWLTRALLILADHQISAERSGPRRTARDWDTDVWANTQRGRHRSGTPTAKGARSKPRTSLPRQSLAYHLTHVAEAAERLAGIACEWLTPGRPAGPSTAMPAVALRAHVAATRDPRYAWQTTALHALRARVAHSPEPRPTLLFITTPTGSGKTRFAAAALRALNVGVVRASFAMPLRYLTHQTAVALAADAEGVTPSDVLCVTGEHCYRPEGSGPEDEDGNALARPAPSTDHAGSWPLPQALADALAAQPTGSHAMIAAPVLVCTVDQLLHAGDPTAQGAHGVALLRLLSADLVLDEIDSYPPERMASVLRLITWAAVAGRNVLCASATLSAPIARACEHAFAVGLARRAALLGAPISSARLLVSADGALHDLHSAAAPPRAPLCLDSLLRDQAHALARRGPVVASLPLAEPSTAAWMDVVAAQIVAAHSELAWTSASGRRHSAGIVRIAHIRDAIAIARALPSTLRAHSPDFAYRLCVLHGQLPLAWRATIEQRLASVLSRKGPSPFDTFLADPDLHACDGPLIVISTAVIESGSDLCFDWAIPDVWSWHSFHQLRGRVMRHRCADARPRIFVPERSIKHCREHAATATRRRTPQPYWRPGHHANVTESQAALLGLAPHTPDDRLLTLDLQHAHDALQPSRLDPIDGEPARGALTADHYTSTALRERATWRTERWAARPAPHTYSGWDVRIYCPAERQWIANPGLMLEQALPPDAHHWPPAPTADASAWDAWSVQVPTLGASPSPLIAFHGRWGFGPP